MYVTNDKKTSSFSIVTVVNVLFLRIETQLGFHKAVFLKYVFIKKIIIRSIALKCQIEYIVYGIFILKNGWNFTSK